MGDKREEAPNDVERLHYKIFETFSDDAFNCVCATQVHPVNVAEILVNVAAALLEMSAKAVTPELAAETMARFSAAAQEQYDVLEVVRPEDAVHKPTVPTSTH